MGKAAPIKKKCPKFTPTVIFTGAVNLHSRLVFSQGVCHALPGFCLVYEALYHRAFGILEQRMLGDGQASHYENRRAHRGKFLGFHPRRAKGGQPQGV